MLFRRRASDEDVVDIHIDGWEATEDLVHETLKRLGCVSESKWHLDELEKSERGGDGGLRNVGRGHWYLVIGPDQVEL